MTLRHLVFLVSATALLASACGSKKKKDKGSAKNKLKTAAGNASLAEAETNLAKIWQGARAAFEMGAVVSRDGKTKPMQFPQSTPLTPATPCCKQPGKKCKDTDWDHPTWSKLTFEISDPHVFQYQLISSGTKRQAKFTARAVADPDCDGKYTVVERYGVVDAKLRVVSTGSQTVKHNVSPPFE